MGRTIQPGTFYRHFKDKLYQIITVAYHSEDGQPMVVYQALYGDYKVYVRPLDMFLSEVDREKYPDCRQHYRFEQVELTDPNGSNAPDNVSNPGNPNNRNNLNNRNNPETPDISGDHSALPGEPEPAEEPNKYLLRFLEAETIAAKLEVMEIMRGHVDAAQVESICMTMDIPYEPGDVERQMEGIRKVLKMRQHYDGGRLRS